MKDLLEELKRYVENEKGGKLKMNKKKSIRVSLVFVLVLCLSFSFCGKTNASAKDTVVRVRIIKNVSVKNKVVKIKVIEKEQNKNYKFYGIVKGIDKKGRVVWQYRTPKESAGEISCVLCKVKGNSVYIVTASRLIRLNKKTGKKICDVKNENLAGATSLNIQKNGICYITTYYDNTMVKISKNGKIYWKTNFNHTKYYWPYKVKIQKKKLVVWFDAAMDDTAKIPHKMVISKKSGKIVSGRR
ncbi:MAG: hypothetical protein IIY81_10855 [Lachnospiraceae bacterium]|nr:hypothetical protein [Lachnospiraceae bacterium]